MLMSDFKTMQWPIFFLFCCTATPSICYSLLGCGCIIGHV
jgi:hypothetical protein